MNHNMSCWLLTCMMLGEMQMHVAIEQGPKPAGKESKGLACHASQ